MASAQHPPRLPAAVLVAALPLLIGMAGAPAAQAAQRCVAPPGLSGIEQYCETLPGAGGNRPSAGEPGSEGGRQRATGDVVPGSVRRRLSQAGRDGAAVLALPDGASANGAGAGGSGGNRVDSVGGATGGSDASGSSTGVDGSGAAGATDDARRGRVLNETPFVDALKSSADSGATGAPLPWILLGVALLLGALAWIRRRAVA